MIRLKLYKFLGVFKFFRTANDSPLRKKEVVLKYNGMCDDIAGFLNELLQVRVALEDNMTGQTLGTDKWNKYHSQIHILDAIIRNYSTHFDIR